MKNFGGKVLFLNRSDINTDEIIPAKYLAEISKEALKPNLLEDLKLAGFDPAHSIAGKSVIVARANFGCGSSREHAPWVLEVNGINLVIAENFARIFRQNMYNCGMMAIELPPPVIEKLFSAYSGRDCELKADLKSSVFTIQETGRPETATEVPFKLEDFDRALVEAGGWVEYADKRY